MRCPEFYEKLERDGNFCGLSPSAISQIKAYRELIDKISKQGIDRTLVYERLPERAAREITSLKDDETRIKALNYAVACIKRGENVTGADLKTSIRGWLKGDGACDVGSGSRSKKFTMVKKETHSAPESAKEPQIVKPPAAQTKPLLPVEKPQETAAPPAPFAAAMKAKFTQPENKPAPVAPVTTGQPIKPEHAVILSVAYCQAKKCEHLQPCKERGGRIECLPAGAEPRHMNECPIEKRKRIAQEQGFGTAADYDPTNGAKFIKHPPYKITKAPMTIHFEPSSKQQVFIETALKSGKFDTSEQVLSQALDLWMDQEGV